MFPSFLLSLFLSFSLPTSFNFLSFLSFFLFFLSVFFREVLEVSTNFILVPICNRWATVKKKESWFFSSLWPIGNNPSPSADCSIGMCLSRCISTSTPRDDSVELSIQLPKADDEWTMAISYTCKASHDTLDGSPTRTCFCGEWNDSEPVCKSKSTRYKWQIISGWSLAKR